MVTSKNSHRMPVTLRLSRSAVATLGRIRTKRLEAGARPRDIQNGKLVEEAISLLKHNEGL